MTEPLDYSAMEDLGPEYGGRAEKTWIAAEIDPRLIELLDHAMDEWGAQGVARAVRGVVELRVTRVRTDNDFLLAKHGSVLVFMLKISAIRTRQEAFRTAAWLVCMGEVLPNEVPGSEFEEVLEAVRNT